jgi:hypothetical protein
MKTRRTGIETDAEDEIDGLLATVEQMAAARAAPVTAPAPPA